MAPSVRSLAALAAAQPAARASRLSDPVRPTIRRHINEVKDCYERGLLRVPTLSGRVVLQFTIDRDGAVAQASVSSDALRDSEALSCIVDHAARWRFPSSPDGRVTTVTYPFVFQAKAPPELLNDPQRRNEIRFCYEVARRSQSELAGELALSISVTGSGTVAVVVAKSAIPSPSLSQCITAAVRRWTFPVSGEMILRRTLFFQETPETSE
jgi:outer membrane biosynthesis protein TonB